ncbi:MAG: hypothetical protein LC749_10905 [Actinobacteria bacterium]|nr:hypothetical protein [Actinomycetota bacterium]
MWREQDDEPRWCGAVSPFLCPRGGRAQLRRRLRQPVAQEETAAAATADRAPKIDEEPNRGRAAPRGSSTTTTTRCADVGTFQGCPTHGGPMPGSEEDCRSANPVGPCQPRVVLWNSSTHPGPEYGEVVRAEPGQEITALAAGFPAGSEVAFCFGEANAGCLLHDVRQADSDGTATLVILLSAGAPPGDYVVAVCHCVSADEETPGQPVPSCHKPERGLTRLRIESAPFFVTERMLFISRKHQKRGRWFGRRMLFDSPTRRYSTACICQARRPVTVMRAHSGRS